MYIFAASLRMSRATGLDQILTATALTRQLPVDATPARSAPLIGAVARAVATDGSPRDANTARLDWRLASAAVDPRLAGWLVSCQARQRDASVEPGDVGRIRCSASPALALPSQVRAVSSIHASGR